MVRYAVVADVWANYLLVINFSATTHPGNRYQHNEDAVGWSEKAGMWFVADGMGGHARGDIAAETVKKTLLSAAADPDRSLVELIMVAHEAVVLEGIERSLHNMGSTVVLARIRDAELNVAWCGDSRAYLFRAGEFVQLTRDHSLLEQLLQTGVVTPDEAFGHPRRNVLVQALGINDPAPEPSEVSVALCNGDLVLLSSDGLHDELRDETIADVVRALEEPQAIVDELERRVLKGDARDNLSIICLQVAELPVQGSGPVEIKGIRQPSETIRRSASETQRRRVPTREVPVARTPARAAASLATASGHAAGRKRSWRESRANMELWIAVGCVVLLVALVLLLT